MSSDTTRSILRAISIAGALYLAQWSIPSPHQALAQQPPAEPPETEPPPLEDFFSHAVDERMASDVERMISQLGSPDYGEREAGTEGLIEIGTPAFTRLRKAYGEADDLEVRLRIERVVHTAFLDHEVYSRHAFLGISLGPYMPRTEQAIEVPPGTVGVVITNVIPNTAALRAGLQKEDVIIEVDGRRLTGTGPESVNTFSQGIAARRPGTHMLLVVMRADGRHEYDITLGRCPRERVQQTRIREKYEAAGKRFAEWWSKNFAPSSAR